MTRNEEEGKTTERTILVSRRDLTKWLCLKSLYFFVKEFWSAYETSPFSDCWLIEFLCECYQYSIKHFLPQHITSEWISDSEYERIKRETGGGCAFRDVLLPNGEHTRNHDLNMPPRHMKSSIVNVMGPVWTILNTPITVTSVSHSMGLSSEMMRKKQKLLNSDKYTFYFGDDPERQLVRNKEHFLQLANGGITYSIAMDSFTGFGSDVIINDDLISVADARQNGAVLQHARDYYKTTMPSRLNNKKTGVVWHIMQRIARGDISDLIQEDRDLRQIYSHTELQAVADKEQVFIYPCSGKIHRVMKGDLLWEDRFGDYTQLKMEIGRLDFETQYNQTPSASMNNIIKDEMIFFIDDKDVLDFEAQADTHYASHDCPIKGVDTSDYHGYCEAYGKNNELVIVDAFEEHLGYIAEKELLERLQTVDPAVVQVIEDKANGSALLQDLEQTVQGLVAFNPGTRSKAQRVELASSYMEKGLVRFTHNEKNEYLIQQLKKFPFVEHDDIIDAFSQLVIYHFTQRNLGVYAEAFNFENLLSPQDIEQSKWKTYGVTFNGSTIKVAEVQQTRNGDIIVTSERMFTDFEKFESFCKNEVVPGNTIYDCSPQNRLSSLLVNVFNIDKFRDRDRERSINLLKTGFFKKRVKVSRDCKQTINDIARLRFTTHSREQGLDKTETLDEGMAGCVRGVVTQLRGLSGQWY